MGDRGGGRGWQPRNRKLEESIKTRKEKKRVGARWFVGGSDKKFIRRSVGAGGVAIMEKTGDEKRRRR